MRDDLTQGMGPKIDPMSYPQITCDKCGHNTFRQEVIMYNIPGVALGGGAGDIPYPIPVYVCAKCGTIIKAVRDEIEKAEEDKKKNKEAVKGTTLIL